MTKYKIFNGKLCDANGNPIPLEVGNKEQIAFLKAYERYMGDIKNGGVEVDIDVEVEYHFTASFKCICDGWVVKGELGDSEDDIDSMEGLIATCRNCKTSYILNKDEDGLLKAKIHS